MRWILTACAFTASLVLLFCTHAGAALLTYALERQAWPLTDWRLRQAQAIVVLGGRTARVHYGAALHRQTGLPLVLTGKGTGDHPYAAESQKMEEILRERYRIVPKWVETEALDTLQNAVFTACMLQGSGMRSIVLITDPRHMARAWTLFTAAGFHVVPAPAPDGPLASFSLRLESFVPSREGFQAASRPAKEWAAAFMEPLVLVFRRPGCGSAAAGH